MLLNFTYYFFKKICFSYKLVLPLHYENKLLKIESSLFNSFLNETSFYKKKKNGIKSWLKLFYSRKYFANERLNITFLKGYGQ